MNSLACASIRRPNRRLPYSERVPSAAPQRPKSDRNSESRQTIIRVAKPAFSKKDQEKIVKEVKQILRSGWLTSGPFVQTFEKRFQHYLNTPNTVAVNSCTSALHAILSALDVKHGDEILVPTNTFVATANVVLYTGAQPVLVESDPDTFNISVEDFERKITSKTKAVIPVHIGGNPCEMREISKVARAHEVAVIEDAAHAMGSQYKGKLCGTIGIAGAFSFYPTKIITTGEGGMVATNDRRLAEKIRIIRNHGRKGYGPSENVVMGYNYRMSDILAAIGLSQLDHVNDFLKHRLMIAQAYEEQLQRIPWLKIQQVERDNLSSYYAFIVKLERDAPISRDRLASRLRSKGIETSVMYHPIHLQPFHARILGHKRGQFPTAEEIGDRSMALPMDNQISRSKAQTVVKAIQSVTR